MSTRQPTIRLLFLGCGAAARMHGRTLRRLGGVELHFASRDPARAASLARRFPGALAHQSYDAALDDPTIDVAFVATPTVTHLELAIRALDAGKHAIVEKPAFMRASDVDTARATAERVARRVFVAENYAYKPLLHYLRRAALGGDLGEIRFLSIDATRRQVPAGWRADPSLSGGGGLFEAGVHWFSFVSGLGLAIEEVRAHRVGGTAQLDLSSLVIFHFAKGAVGTLAHSWELPAPLRGLRISRLQGTRGAVTFESNGIAAFTTGRRRSVRAFLRDPFGYRAMFADFLAALRTGSRERFTLTDARRDLRLLELAVASMRGAGPHSRHLMPVAVPP